MFRSLLATTALLVALHADAQGQPDPVGGGAEGGNGHEGKPCECKDLTDMRAMLKMVKTTRAAWYSVLADMYGGHGPNNGDEAKTLFYKYMGWSSANVKDVGKVSRTGDIIIDPAFREQHCDSIIEGTQKHESAHFWYFISRSIGVTLMGAKAIGMVLAKSEIDSRNVQSRYLSDAIKALRTKCGRDYSPGDDDPKPASRIQSTTPN